MALRKLFAFWIALALLLGGVGGLACRPNHQKRSPRFAYIAKEREQAFHEGIVNGIRKAKAKKSLEVDILSATSQHDVETQKKYIRKIAKEKNYSGVMICANDSAALVPEIRLLDEAGIPFLLIDTPLVENKVSKGFRHNCGYVGSDNFLAGEMAYEFLAERLSGGSVLLVRGIHSQRSSIDREEGFMRKNRETGRFKVLGPIVGNWGTRETYETFSKFMLKHQGRSLAGVFAYADHMAIGVGQWYREQNRAERPLIVSVDGTVVGQKGVLENRIDASVVQATELMGIEGVNRMLECYTDRPIKKVEISTPLTLLTASRAMARRDL